MDYKILATVFVTIFVAELGETPARYIEKLRLEAARTLLESQDLPLKTIAGESGFGSLYRSGNCDHWC